MGASGRLATMLLGLLKQVRKIPRPVQDPDEFNALPHRTINALAVSIQSGRAERNRRDAKSAEKSPRERALKPITFQLQILKRLRRVRLCALRVSAV